MCQPQSSGLFYESPMFHFLSEVYVCFVSFHKRTSLPCTSLAALWVPKVQTQMADYVVMDEAGCGAKGGSCRLPEQTACNNLRKRLSLQLSTSIHAAQGTEVQCSRGILAVLQCCGVRILSSQLGIRSMLKLKQPRLKGKFFPAIQDSTFHKICTSTLKG